MLPPIIPPEPPITVGTLHKEIESLIKQIDKAEDQLARGKIMDLTQANENVVSLCEKISTLPNKDAMKLQEKMVQIISKLEAFAYNLNNFKNGF